MKAENSNSKNSKWRKLDNAALTYPAVMKKNHTRVFRFYCQLKEQVDPEVLQTALDETMETYPLFQAVLRKGLFWYYLEQRDIRAEVQEEKKPPCSRLYIPDKKALLFEVSYYKNRINFEVFHALTDGTGAMHFLQELVQNYLRHTHPELSLPRVLQEETRTAGHMEEDSFSQYYTSVPQGKETKKPTAVQLKGERVPHEDMHITEMVLPVKETLAKARSYGVSITVFLTAVILWAIHEEIPRSRQNRPVVIAVPVNLRNYFSSQSMTNFFALMEVGCQFRDSTTFTEVLESVKTTFMEELTKEKIAMRMSKFVRMEKNPFLRAVPLELKKYCLQIGANLSGRSTTAVYSNVGIIRLPGEYSGLIERFGIFASTDTLQLCSCSYGDELVLSFTSKLTDDSIERNFKQILKEEALPCKEDESDFPGHHGNRKEGRQIYQTFTFLCIAAAVVCGMINYMMQKQLSWFWFAGAGSLCAWLIVSVAYTKRRNILKNEMWELLLVTVGSILWDVVTGWRSWSVDFVMPVGALAVLCSVPVIAKISRLEKEEYLFYLVQAALLGCIPPVLVWAGVVRIPHLAVLCGGISFLVLAGLFIFRKKDTVGEFHKKLRM